MIDVPPWVVEAERRLGEREIAGVKDNAYIVECLRRVGIEAAHDETAWCAAFANRCLEDAGVRGTGSAAALSFTRAPTRFMRLGEFRLGAIAVFSRVDPQAPKVPHGHVGFALAELCTNVVLLGGNQRNAVTIEPRTTGRLLGYYWPVGVP